MAGALGFHSHLKMSYSKADCELRAWMGPENWWMSLEDNLVRDLAIAFGENS